MYLSSEPVVIPQEFTGREPVVVDSSQILEIRDLRDEWVLTLRGGQEISLSSLLSGATSRELFVLLFGDSAQTFLAFASVAPVPGHRKLNPALICSLEHGERGTTVHMVDGKSAFLPGSVETYRNLVRVLYGEELSQQIRPYKVPDPSPGALASLRLAMERTVSRQKDADDTLAEREQKERQKALNYRFKPVNAPRVRAR